MASSDLTSVYRTFYDIFGDSRLLRSSQELEAAIMAAGLACDAVGVEWLRALDPRWVYLETDDPFADAGANREYRRIVSRMGA